MNNILEYKGYHAKIEFDAKSLSVRGKIEGINDFVDFETNDLSRIEEEFHCAVDDYLDFCIEVGKNPDKEYKGTFNVRIAPELHRAISIMAIKKGASLNTMVEQAIEEYLVDDNQVRKSLKTSVDLLTETIKSETAYQYSRNTAVDRTKVLTFPERKISYSCNVRTVSN